MVAKNAEIIYETRLVKISRSIDSNGKKYKIEMTDGRFCRFWERYFANDEDAIEAAKQGKDTLN